MQIFHTKKTKYGETHLFSSEKQRLVDASLDIIAITLFNDDQIPVFLHPESPTSHIPFTIETKPNRETDSDRITESQNHRTMHCTPI